MFRWANLNLALVAVSISAEDAPAPAPDTGACASITISNGCKDTYMGSIEGLYRPIAGSSCAGRPAYANGDGSKTMFYDGEQEYWRVGHLCNENCRCLPPSYATFNFGDAEVDCFDGREGHGSSASNSYVYTDLEVTCNNGSAGGGGGGGSTGSSPVSATPAPPTSTNAPATGGGEGGGSPGSSTVSAIPAPPTSTNNAPTKSKDQFCRDLRNLEAHMTKGFEDLTEKRSASSFRCSCETVPLISEEFQINCVLEYIDSGERLTNFERMIFRYSYSYGSYQIIESSWGDTSFGSAEADTPQEVYRFEDGALDSCEANGCTSCDVCDDGRSVTLACVDGSTSCGDGYAGSLANAFDFGTIARDAGDGAAAAGRADASPATSVGASASVGLALLVSSLRASM